MDKRTQEWLDRHIKLARLDVELGIPGASQRLSQYEYSSAHLTGEGCFYSKIMASHVMIFSLTEPCEYEAGAFVAIADSMEQCEELLAARSTADLPGINGRSDTHDAYDPEWPMPRLVLTDKDEMAEGFGFEETYVLRSILVLAEEELARILVLVHHSG